MMLVRVGMAASGGQDELAEVLSVWVVLVVVMQDGSGSGRGVGAQGWLWGGSTWTLLLEMFCFLSWVAVSEEFFLLCFIHNLYLYHTYSLDVQKFC